MLGQDRQMLTGTVEMSEVVYSGIHIHSFMTYQITPPPQKKNLTFETKIYTMLFATTNNLPLSRTGCMPCLCS
jgi:hypothetical protein